MQSLRRAHTHTHTRYGLESDALPKFSWAWDYTIRHVKLDVKKLGVVWLSSTTARDDDSSSSATKRRDNDNEPPFSAIHLSPSLVSPNHPPRPKWLVIGAKKSTQTFFVQSFSTTLRVMDVCAENRGRPHQKVRFPAARWWRLKISSEIEFV